MFSIIIPRGEGLVNAKVMSLDRGKESAYPMKMALNGSTILLVDVNSAQFAIIKSWSKMRWNAKEKQLEGTADLELLDKLSGLVRLAPSVEARRQELRQVLDAVDRERTNPEPKPFYKYPVKLPLYTHQVRGANMALLEFGWVPPEGDIIQVQDWKGGRT